MFDVHPSDIIWKSVDKYWHVQISEAQSIRHSTLISEIRQRHQHTIDLVAMLSKQVRAQACLCQRFYSPIVSVSSWCDNNLNANFAQHFQDCLATLASQPGGKKSTVTYDDCQSDRALIQT
jgi:hypothetical protein